MGKVEAIIKSEIVRLAKREVRKISVPLGRDVRVLKSAVSQLRKAILALERFTALQKKESEKKISFEAAPEEVEISRLSPRLVRSLRKRLGVSQRELARLTGVTPLAVYQWETGTFKPKKEKKAILVGLRKLGRRDVKKLLEERGAEGIKRKVRKPKASKK
ncbi:MAG: helix-turn-helix domain-containing protein [Thermodesulfobacteriota bacterium]|nr:helix-turn-helix domain-containing protein [Thermodesulfobacteriota bacterium]